MSILRTSHINGTTYRALPQLNYRAAAGEQVLKYNVACRVSYVMDVTAYLLSATVLDTALRKPVHLSGRDLPQLEHDYIGGREYTTDTRSMRVICLIAINSKNMAQSNSIHAKPTPTIFHTYIHGDARCMLRSSPPLFVRKDDGFWRRRRPPMRHTPPFQSVRRGRGAEQTGTSISSSLNTVLYLPYLALCIQWHMAELPQWQGCRKDGMRSNRRRTG
ncbi:hypothetical protein GGR52DRAFT_398522 [Hypoxylon sp. FL1284]|nr:hypothetical protein GGR52DRAFT_398522 [Hypoxylon sp. FL1284]